MTGSPAPAGLHSLSSSPMTNSKKIALRLTEFPDQILAEILLRLPTASDLARASAACVSIRRLVTDRYFLRCFRRLHSPPLLGFVDGDGFYPARPPQFHPAQPPHASTPGARALALAADFTFSFLPSHCRWTVQDIRDGRVLLHRRLAYDEQIPLFRELVVCDPLHRRYILLPPVPDDLAPSVQPRLLPRPQSDPFLAPLGEEAPAAMAETLFRVIYMIHCKLKLTAIVFSSSAGQWTAAASKAWGDLLRGKDELDIMSKMHAFFLRRHYAYGCFYWDWLLIQSKKLLVLDTRKMDFSMSDLPPGEWTTQGQGLAIVDAGEGMPGMFGFHSIFASDLSYTIARNKDESPTQWQTEKISLDSGYKYFITDATQRYLLLGRAENPYVENALIEYFSMDIKTLKLQRVCARQGIYTYGLRIYDNFPPSLLSSSTI
ncbi:unnamed protein product [Alopecurus aequalis]